MTDDDRAVVGQFALKAAGFSFRKVLLCRDRFEGRERLTIRFDYRCWGSRNITIPSDLLRHRINDLASRAYVRALRRERIRPDPEVEGDGQRRE